MLRRDAFRLPRHPASVGVARRRAHDHLMAWGRTAPDGHLDDVLLLVSELATNVVRHGPLPEREFEVAVTALADGSCVVEVSEEVSDDSSGTPRPRTAQWADESGRGLFLVEAVADAWGVWNRGPSGQTVWALVRPPR